VPDVFDAAAARMNDPIPHPVASILFGLAVVALLLWQGSEADRLAKHSAQFLSKLTEGTQAARLPQQIHSVPKPLQAEAEIKPKPTTKIYYRVMVPDSGTLEAGDVVIKLNGIFARKAEDQCQDEKGKNWPCGAAAKAALRRLIRARAVVCELPEPGEQKSFTARCAVGGTDLSTWMVRQGWAKPNDPPEPALADAAEAAKSEHIGLWRRGEFDKPLITNGAAAVRTTSLERSEITARGSRSR
jgi:endonuclease YncB( thermonuclease family)